MDHGGAETPFMKSRITRSLLEGLVPARLGSSYYVMDTEIPGFGVRVFPSGRSVYVVRWKGKPHEISDTRLQFLEAARTEARRLRLRLEEGEAPAVQRLFVEEARRVLAPDTFSAILEAAQRRYIDAGGSLSEANKILQHTLDELLERMEAEYRSTRNNEAGIRADLSLWRRHTIPALGGPVKRLRDITQAEVLALKDSMRETPVSANRALNLLHQALRLVSRLRPAWIEPYALPTEGVDRYPRYPRKTPLTKAELRALWAAVIAARRLRNLHPVALDLCELVLLTGARPGEPLRALKAWVERIETADDIAAVIRLPSAKGDRPGRTRGRVIALGREAAAIIERRVAAKPDNPYIFPGRFPGKPLTYGAFWRCWRSLLTMARLPHKVPYSARHTYVSEGEDAGAPLTPIKDAVGHQRITTTDSVYRTGKPTALLRTATTMSRHLASYGESPSVEAEARRLIEAHTVQEEPPERVPCGCGCGSMILRYADGKPSRERRFVVGHNRRKRPQAAQRADLAVEESVPSNLGGVA